MRRVTLRSLWQHKRRLVSTVLAVLLGVAFLSGTFVFSDTLNQSLDELFDDVWDGVDVRVQGEVTFDSDFGQTEAPLDEALADSVDGVDGVESAAPYVAVEGFGPNNRVLGPDGEPIGVEQGPPTIFESWLPANPFDYRLTDGSRAPRAAGEVVLDVGAADDGGFGVGERVTLATRFGPSQYTLVGTFTFGGSDSQGGVVVAAFTLAEAQRLAGSEGQADYIVATGADGVSQEELARRVRAALPADVQVLTGEEAAAQDADDLQQGLSFFDQVLTIFGTIALVVATFLIANTFQILVAQRTRELALLRAVGASRRQVFASVLLEALVVGLVAAVLGILAGIALAAGITTLLDALGVELPATSLVVDPGTVVFALAVGTLVTLVSSIAPAVRATRVAPLAALRDVAVEATRASRPRLALAALTLVVGGVNLSRAWTEDGDSDAIPSVGLGALLLLAGVILLGPAVASWAVRAVGAFLPRVRGVTGRLAVENAARSPKRTSATASALLIAVALVGVVTIFAESAKTSVGAEVERGLDADLIVQPEGGGFGGFGFSPEVARAIGEVPGVEVVAAASFEPVRLTYPGGEREDTFVGAVDPEPLAALAEPTMAEGELRDLRPGGVIVGRQLAEDRSLEIGDTIGAAFTAGGSLDLRVDAVSDDPTLLGPITMHRADLGSLGGQRLDAQILVEVSGGGGETLREVQRRVEAAIASFPGIEVVNRDEFVGDVADQLTAFVNVIYGLLALSVLIAMIGVANTLSLSVHERIRELGLLRAVGMARTQLRASIRWEAVLIALLGAVSGLGVGLLASFALVESLSGMGLTAFAVPVPTLAIQVALAAGFAVLASVRTARRAARLDILAAIATE
ncbi:MAG TPA: FtsX-like permease family protein [Acidimicrobiales bacterium]|nr:FtsX-like permease family protein [Acidimicrobiales bacterium]